MFLSQSPLAMVAAVVAGCMCQRVINMPITVFAWTKTQGPGPIKVKIMPPIERPITLVKL